jgi:tetrahydromethanopterin S-methyltransferase subunit G
MEALKMERPMDNWNDARLDELSRRIDEGFKEMREGFARTPTREEVNGRFADVGKRLDRLENRVDRFYYSCLALLVLLIGSSIANTVIG